MTKYNEFIIESLVYKLINEANVVYKKEFIDILNDMKSGFHDPVDKIVEILLKISNKDLDIKQNNIGLSDENDKISFIPEDKIDQAVIKVSIVVNSIDNKLHPVQVDAGLPLEGMIFIQPESYVDNDIINTWKLVRKIDMSTIEKSIYTQYNLYYLQNIENPKIFTTTFIDKDDEVNKCFEYILPNQVNKLKIGRFVNRILDLYLGSDPIERRRFTTSDIEKFSNKFVGLMEYQNNAFDHFKIVSGEEIKHWYLDDNYSNKNGQLGQSCMKYLYCQEYFNIYIENPDVCKLLIFTDIDDKLLGRSLLWVLDDGSLYMDRIYTTKDYNIDLFNTWAINNEYKKTYKKGNIGKLTVNVKPKSYERYPYMDTFKYYKPEEGILTSFEDNLSKPFYELQDNSGQAIRRYEEEPSRG